MIKQFLRDVDWGEVDFLIVDTPPGTSDEHLSVVQYLAAAHIDGAVIITTPQVSRCGEQGPDCTARDREPGLQRGLQSKRSLICLCRDVVCLWSRCFS